MIMRRSLLEVFVLYFKLISLGSGILLLIAQVGHAAENEPGYKADAEHGLDLAKRSCASCHVVSAEQQRASVDLPPFAVIAQSPNFNPDRLAHYSTRTRKCLSSR